MWNPEIPIKYLEPKIAGIFSREADFLYEELIFQKLEVELSRAPDQKFPNHKIRRAISHNPAWYSELYHSKNHIKRKSCEKSLDRIRNYKDGFFTDPKYIYDLRFREMIFEKLYNGINYLNLKFESNEEVREYFDYKKIPKLSKPFQHKIEVYCPF